MNYNLKDNLNAMLFLTFIFAVCLTVGTLFPSAAYATGTITDCTGCHGFAPVDNPTRDGVTGKFPGSHDTHAGAWYTTTDSRYSINCEVCHYSPLYTLYSHQGNSIQVNLRWFSIGSSVVQSGSVSGWGSYSKGVSVPRSNTPTFGYCLNTYCHSNGAGGTLQVTGQINDSKPIEPGNISPMWSTGPTSVPCFPCHGHEAGNPGTGAPWYASTPLSTAGGVKANSHTLHAWQTAGTPGGAVCYRCHYTTTNTGTTITSVGNHIKRSYTVSPGPFDYPTTRWLSYTYAYGTTGGTCTNPSCHTSNTASGAFERWGSNSSAATCVKCHGISGSTSLQWTNDNNVAAPGYSTLGVNTWGTRGTFTNNVSDAPKVWAHNSHLSMNKGYSTIRGVECEDCHDSDTIVANVWTTNHMNGVTNFVWSSLTRNVGNNNPDWNTLALSPWYSSGNQACGNIYCHGQSITDAGVWGTAWSSLRFNNNQWLTAASAKNSRSCNSCHQSPPSRTTNFNHSAYTLTSSCAGCHGHEGSGAGHIDGILFADASCLACHVDVQAPRRSMGGEISTIRTHGHMKTASRPFNQFDCGVCHMEGDPKTGKTNPTYHSTTRGNGQLYFRNPDTGGPIEWATFNSGGGGVAPWTTGGYWMTNIGANAWATFFSRNTANATIEPFAASVMVNLCIRCHDANGAASSTAWVTGATSGTQPWGPGTGTTIDVATQFWSTATYHPVMRRQNNSFADKDTMTVWNSFDKGAKSNTAFGNLITCWDCHDSTSGWRTIGGGVPSSSHGYTTIVRASYDWVAKQSTDLCVICHKTSIYWNITIHSVAGTGNTGGNGGVSAWNTTSVDTAGYHVPSYSTRFSGCTACHGNADYAVAVTRPAGPNVHGANTGGIGASPPYSFIRNSTTLAAWAPGSCTMGTCRSGAYTYSPGGSY